MAKGEEIIVIKRKKVTGHGHHGGAWKVAYADFVTAMMAFFLVMWLMGSDDETKQAISHYFNHPNTPYNSGHDPQSNNTVPLGERVGEGDTILSGAEGQFPEDLIQSPSRPPAEALSEYRDLKSKVQSELETLAYGLDLSLDHMKFSIAESELFEANSSELKPGADVILKKVGKLISHYSGYMTISGNVDNQSGSDQNAGVTSYEFTLSRAVSVMNYFVRNRYMPEERIYPIGRGGRRAIASNTTTDGRKKNRRIEFNLSYNKQM